MKNLGAKPRLEYHAPAVLISDPRYQRSIEGRRSQKQIEHIAENFHWPYFGVIIATDNADGTFCVIDGQHRVEAAKRVEGVHSVPVMVLEEMSLNEQASAFIRVNTDRVSLNAMQLHHAAARAGDEQALALEGVLKEKGYRISPTVRAANQRKPRELLCVKALAWIYREFGREITSDVLEIMDRAFGGAPEDMRAALFKTSAKLRGLGRSVDELARVLATRTGVEWEDKGRAEAKYQGITLASGLFETLDKELLRGGAPPVPHPVDPAAGPDESGSSAQPRPKV